MISGQPTIKLLRGVGWGRQSRGICNLQCECAEYQKSMDRVSVARAKLVCSSSIGVHLLTVVNLKGHRGQKRYMLRKMKSVGVGRWRTLQYMSETL